MAKLKKCMANVLSPSCITVLSLMVLWGQIQNYMMRSNLSIIIVAMVKTTSSDNSSSVTDGESYAMAGLGNETKSPKGSQTHMTSTLGVRRVSPEKAG